MRATRPSLAVLLAVASASAGTAREGHRSHRHGYRAESPAAPAASTPADRALAAARIAAAAKLQSVEAEADRAADRLDALSRRRAEVSAALAARAAAVAPLLPLAERLRLDPAEALLAAGASPDTALHGLLVLRTYARQMEREAEALRVEQAELDRLARDIAQETPRLRDAPAAQAAQGAALDRALADARDRRARQDAMDPAAHAVQRAAEQAARQATEAETLGGAVDRVAPPPRDALREDAALTRPPAPEADSDGVSHLAMPVAGRIVQGWGDPTEVGPAGGVTFRAAPQARVVSPCAGRVAFASPFRSFGLLLIVDCGRGYNVVMAGFDRLDAEVGAAVQAGEPVGVMPTWAPQAPGARPGLYVELRRDGQRIDPGPFLRGHG